MNIRSFPQGNWGYVEKCPHCPATNIKRNTKNQKTCGKDACRLAQKRAIR